MSVTFCLLLVSVTIVVVALRAGFCLSASLMITTCYWSSLHSKASRHPTSAMQPKSTLPPSLFDNATVIACGVETSKNNTPHTSEPCSVSPIPFRGVSHSSSLSFAASSPFLLDFSFFLTKRVSESMLKPRGSDAKHPYLLHVCTILFTTSQSLSPFGVMKQHPIACMQDVVIHTERNAGDNYESCSLNKHLLSRAIFPAAAAVLANKCGATIITIPVTLAGFSGFI